MRSTRPLLVVAHGGRSVSTMAITAAARELCDLLWLVNSFEDGVSAMIPLLARSGLVVDVAGLSTAAIVSAVRAEDPQGLVSFRDDDLVGLAILAHELNLDFHSLPVARALADKVEQRRMLGRGGVPVPGWWDLPGVETPNLLHAAAAAVRYPAVVKPRQGAGSRHTFLATDARHLLDVLTQLAPEARTAQRMVAEEFLGSTAPLTNGPFADYVSVESMVTGSDVVHLGLTGRFPLAEPFRETGFFIPAALGPADEQAVTDAASAAIAALDVRHGFLHTEIKLTADGPRIIEVNGRLGGGVPEMLALANGLPLLSMSMRLALGLPVATSPEQPGWLGVGYRFFHQPPASACRVVSVDGLDELSALPGVSRVSLRHLPGQRLDAMAGTGAYIFEVVGLAGDHAAVVEMDERIRATVAITYVYEQPRWRPSSVLAAGSAG